MVYYLFLSAVAVGLLTSCRHHETRVARANSQGSETGPAILSAENRESNRPAVAMPGGQRTNMEAVVRMVLDAHGFVPPIIKEGPHPIRWAMSTRPASNHELVVASVKMVPEDEALVELILYAHVGSTWALVGHNFRGVIDQETREMNDQIRERLVR